MFTPSYLMLMKTNEIYDTIVLGLGPAGISAAIYLKRFNHSVLAIGLDGGSLKGLHHIDNYYGSFHLSGDDILNNGYAQAEALGIELKFEEIVDIEVDSIVHVKTNLGNYEAKTLFLALGLGRKKPNIGRLKDYEGKGVSYCATCDGFLYRNKPIALLGEGKLMEEEYDVLSHISDKVYVLTNGKKIDFKVKVNEDEIDHLEGEEYLERIVFKNGESLHVDALFVASGLLDTFKSAKKIGLAMNENDEIIVDENRKTNVPFIFAGGDMISGVKQIAKAVDDGMKAAYAIHKLLSK